MIVLIIDARSNARQLTFLLKSHQIDVINIITPAHVTARTEENCFSQVIRFNGDVTHLCQSIGPKKVLGVYTSTDCNQKLKYQLINYFIPNCINNMEYDFHDKKQLQSFLKEKKLPCLPSFEINNFDSLNKLDRCYSRYILKPQISTGSIDTKVFFTKELVSKKNRENSSIEQLINKKLTGSFQNSKLIAQPYIEGEEYACSFSWYSMNSTKVYIRIRSVVRLEKFLLDHTPIPLNSSLISHNHPVINKIYSYLEVICPSLPLKYGVANFGAMLDKNGSLYIFDFNDRLSGLSGSSIGTYSSTGSSQMIDFLQLLLSPKQYLKGDKIAPANGWMCMMYLSIKRGGMLSIKHSDMHFILEYLYRLSSYKAHQFEILKSGESVKVSKTIDQLGQIGRVILYNDQKKTFDQDKIMVRNLEDYINDKLISGDQKKPEGFLSCQ